jgi:large subunit ribosomal protein L14e
MKEIILGQVVISKAGRDKGDYFVVMDIKNEYAFLADGHNRTLDRLKAKKFKHIQPTNDIIDGIKNKIENQLKIANLDIREALNKCKNPQSQSNEN